MLLRFSRLGDAEPERILSFAQRFGVLELCAHERPHTHPPLPDEDLNPVGGAGYCRPTQREPLRIWRSYATRCAAVMRIAERVHDDAPGSRDDWEIYYTPAFPTDVSGAPDGAGKTLEGDRYTLGRALDGWLAVGGVRARLEWGPDQGRPKMSVGSPTLFGAIAREIAFVASGSGGLLQCHGCGALFTPDRKPRKGERPWCVDCSEKGEPLKAAKRRYRQRRRRHNRKERD
ncbi:MAG TPA: hypothetical protein VML95_02160 [Longimicrobiales bacterium]|nr:hypothetical protein [Longimicrobiales bacterium]